MSLIRLNKLEITNFRSWKHLVLDGFSDKGLCLILGDNGSGKSSIRQAIEYLLTDSISDGISPSDIVKHGESFCVIKGEFSVGDDEIVIEKYRNHPKHGNKIFFIVNGDDSLTYRDRRVTQDAIFRYFGFDKNTLFVSTIFSSNSPSFPEIRDTERKEILFKNLDLIRYEKYHQVVCDRIDQIDHSINELNLEIGIKETEIERMKGELESAEYDMRTFNDRKRQRIRELEQELDSYKIVDTSDLEKELKSLLSYKDELTNKFNGDKYDSLKLEYDEISREMFSLEREMDKLDEYPSECPILRVECDRLVKESNKVLRHKQKLSQKYKSLSKKLNAVKSELETLDRLLDEISGVNQRTESVRMEIERIDEKNKSIDEIKGRILNEIEKVKSEKNPYGKIVDNLKREINLRKVEIESVKKEIDELQDEMRYWEFWKVGFSKNGIPNMKLESYLHELETETNSILLSIDSPIYIVIDSQLQLRSKKEYREKISYKVVDGDRESDFVSYSGGERQRIKLADMFAFNRLFGKFDFIILDEILELSLDDSGKESVIRLLREKAKEIGSIFVISHDDKVKGYFDNVMNIRKVDGVSEIR